MKTRHFGILIAVLVLAAMLTACSGGGGGDGSTGDTGSSSYTIGGTVSGLTGTLSLQNNGTDDILISSGTASFTFPRKIVEGSAYNVTVHIRPSGQSCIISNGTGTITSADVSNVSVDCTTNPTFDDIKNAAIVSLASVTNYQPAPSENITVGPATYSTSYSQPLFHFLNSAPSLSVNADTATFTYEADVRIDMTVFSSLSGTIQGEIVITGVTSTVTAGLTTDDGLKQIGNVTGQELTFSSITTPVPTLDPILTLLSQYITTTMESYLGAALANFTSQIIATLPVYDTTAPAVPCAAPAIDVTGSWLITENSTSNTCGADVRPPYAITITQSGNSLSIDTPSGNFSGQMCGSTASWTGSYPDSGGTATITSLSAAVTGSSFSGSSSWQWTNGTISCSGSTQFSGAKQ